VIPVHDAERGLDAAIRRLCADLDQQLPVPWIITIADSASRDGTWGVACRLANQLDGVQVLHLNQPGRGRALRHAWLASEVPVVAHLDLVRATDLRALLPLVAPLLAGQGDLAIGTAVGADRARLPGGPPRGVLARSRRLFRHARAGHPAAGAPRTMQAICVDAAHAIVPLIDDDGCRFDAELLVRAEHRGLRIHEVPVRAVQDAA